MTRSGSRCTRAIGRRWPPRATFQRRRQPTLRSKAGAPPHGVHSGRGAGAELAPSPHRDGHAGRVWRPRLGLRRTTSHFQGRPVRGEDRLRSTLSIGFSFDERVDFLLRFTSGPTLCRGPTYAWRTGRPPDSSIFTQGHRGGPRFGPSSSTTP
eukprot:2911404-Pyramimonas_sp.AAC.1